MTKKRGFICGQCGQPFTARACSPTHALIARELREGPYAAPKLRRLKQRIASILWELPDARKKINDAIDAWALAERKRV